MEATPEEVNKYRFSPRLIRSHRKSLGIRQRELAILAGVTAGGSLSRRMKRKQSWWRSQNLVAVLRENFWRRKALEIKEIREGGGCHENYRPKWKPQG